MIPIRYNIRSLMERRATSLMTVLGVGMVAMIIVILFGFIGGLQSSLLNAAGDRNYIIVSKGAPQENASRVPRDQLDILRVSPEIAQSGDGAPLISPEAIAGVNVSRDNRVKEFVLLRGVTPMAYQVHDGMRLVSGRWPVRGSNEWVVGHWEQSARPLSADPHRGIRSRPSTSGDESPTTNLRASVPAEECLCWALPKA